MRTLELLYRRGAEEVSVRNLRCNGLPELKQPFGETIIDRPRTPRCHVKIPGMHDIVGDPVPKQLPAVDGAHIKLKRLLNDARCSGGFDCL